MAGNVVVSIWLQYIWKLFGRTLKNEIIKCPQFHTINQALYKYSLFVQIFIMVD